MRTRRKGRTPPIAAVSYTSNLDDAVLLASLTTAREEAGRSQDAQQSALSWSLGALGALFAGGVAFSANVVTKARVEPEAIALYALIFGLVAPAFGFVAGLAYMGQIRRMVRAAAYIRGIEELLRQAGRPLLLWESFLASGLPEAKPILAPQISAMMLFCGSIFVSMLAFVVGEPQYATAWAPVLTAIGLPGPPFSEAAAIVTVSLAAIGAVLAGIVLWFERRKIAALAGAIPDLRGER